MDKNNFSITITVNQSSQEVFEAFNNVTGWWTENLKGASGKLNDEFDVQFGEVHYSRQKLVEFIPAKKVAWLVTDSTLSFTKDKSEWTGTTIIFEITEIGDKTECRFTHAGLVPAIECYHACSNAWDDYIRNSLFKLITTGKGTPTGIAGQ